MVLWDFFSKGEKGITKAVIELKDAKTLLDKKQSGREKGYTPIEQAYSYASKFDRCNWIIVSNFRESVSTEIEGHKAFMNGLMF